MLVAASGMQGIAGARATLTWNPVQALATEQPVMLVYVTASPQSAAFMTEWDEWRDAGIRIVPLYLERDSVDSQGDAESSVDISAEDRYASHLGCLKSN